MKTNGTPTPACILLAGAFSTADARTVQAAARGSARRFARNKTSTPGTCGLAAYLEMLEQVERVIKKRFNMDQVKWRGAKYPVVILGDAKALLVIAQSPNAGKLNQVLEVSRARPPLGDFDKALSWNPAPQQSLGLSSPPPEALRAPFTEVLLLAVDRSRPGIEVAVPVGVAGSEIATVGRVAITAAKASAPTKKRAAKKVANSGRRKIRRRKK